jgi:hypothetical protein
MKKMTSIERFQSKVKISESGCHEWTGGLSEKGYGVFKGEKRLTWQAHRWIYHYHNPKTPVFLYILHKCDNRKCVNPNHLYSGIQFDNMRDMHERGRANKARGIDSALSIFNESLVSNIKGLYAIGIQAKLIAKCIKQSHSAVWSVISGKTWKHIPTPEIIGSKSHESKRPANVWRHRKPVNMLSKDGIFIKRFPSASDAAIFLNRCPTGFREVVNGRQPTWGGYKWEYANDDDRKRANERNEKYKKFNK